MSASKDYFESGVHPLAGCVSETCMHCGTQLWSKTQRDALNQLVDHIAHKCPYSPDTLQIESD